MSHELKAEPYTVPDTENHDCGIAISCSCGWECKVRGARDVNDSEVRLELVEHELKVLLHRNNLADTGFCLKHHRRPVILQIRGVSVAGCPECIREAQQSEWEAAEGRAK